MTHKPFFLLLFERLCVLLNAFFVRGVSELPPFSSFKKVRKPPLCRDACMSVPAHVPLSFCLPPFFVLFSVYFYFCSKCKRHFA